MDFAKKLLIKYGWKEGQGIGKNADGIVKPVKANLKFDTAGLCFDKAQEFTDHWWEKAFNTAAGNLNVDGSCGNVSISVKKNETIEDKKDSYGGCFKKSKIIDKEHSGENDNQNDFKVDLSDEDILKACGGRTAHKGARHGLSLNGKLSRIDAQEQQMLKRSVISTETAQDIFKDWILVKKKRKDGKNKKHIKTEEEKPIQTLNKNKNDEDYKIKYKSKKSKKQLRDRDEDLAKSFSKLETISHINGLLSSSKIIKKENHLKMGKRHGLKMLRENDTVKSKESERSHYLTSSDSSETNINDDPLQKKKFKKPGLQIQLKTKKRNKKNKNKELAKISKKIKNLNCSNNSP